MESGLQENDSVGNGDYFLTLLRNETAHLNALVSSAEHELETEGSVPEDVRGKLRVAVGKSKMLLRKKFLQFEELCLKNLGIKSDIRYPVTSEDLAGYWDTIVLQILQVYKIFEEIDILRKNNWEEPTIDSNHQSQTQKIARQITGEKIVKEAVTKSEISSEII